jgi:hypothetical protein
MQSRKLRRYLGLSASVLLLAGNSAWAAQTLEYSIRWDTKDDRYHVFMKPNATPSPDISMTGQITIHVPHATGSDAFVVDDPKSPIVNTIWSNDSRADAPDENPSVDYISFSLSKPGAFAWKAGEEKEVLNFRNSGKCIGPVAFLDNDTDPFNKLPNSVNTNPGNQFTNLGWGDSSENNYLDIYGTAADCADSLDSDGDGLKDGVEKILGTDPNNPDTDGDGLTDGVEVNTTKTDPLKADTDGDGLKDGVEVNTTKTDPLKADTDGDGLKDGVEVNTTKTDPLKADTDGDGLKDGVEVNTTKTDPLKADTDSDGLTDGAEINTTKTDPLKADTDGDGLKDGVEVNTTKTDPLKADTDGDGLTDGAEVNTTKTDPLKADTDGDGLADGIEVNRSKTNPLSIDSDGDGIDDKTEVGATPAKPIDTDGDGIPNALDTDDDNDGILTKYENYNGGTPADDDTDGDKIPDYLDTDDDGDGKVSRNEKNDPNGDGSPADAIDSDGDGKPDYLDPNDTDGPNADPDGDGLTNAQEAKLGTDPNKADTDSDGLTDGVEVNNTKTDPLKADTDGDGLTDGAEVNTTKTDPLKADTDGDGLTDGAEVNTTKTDPLKADTDSDGLTDGAEVNTTKTDPLKADTDGDGLTDGIEVNRSKTNPLSIDSDGDGVDDKTEVGATPAKPTDTDGDGIPDALDTDDDNDGILTKYEDINKDGNPANDDTDKDGIPNYLDTDDDGDGILTKDENPDPNGDHNPADAIDTDMDGIPDYLDAIVDAIKLQVKVMLQGAYNSTSKMMQDDLRSKGLIPLKQPYNIGSIKYAGSELAPASLFTTTGNDAPVDWILVEVRDAVTPTTVKASIAALVQRDGDVMDTTGNTSLMLTGLTPGNYYVSVRHRNHLGVMTAAPVNITSSPVVMVDFTKTTTAVYGKDARITSGTMALLWAGNANVDTRAIANGPSNDTGVILGDVLLAKDNLSVSTNYRLNGYQATDINMDGISIFAGPFNDVNLLLGNILLHPGNSTFSANYIINQQVP